jgi:hypothetical protein
VVRLLSIVVVAFSLIWNSCGGSWTLAGKFGSSSIQHLTGEVSGLYLQYLTDSEGIVQTMTVVTFISAGVPTPLTFCGDQSGMFVENEDVTVKYQPGTACSTLLSVHKV